VTESQLNELVDMIADVAMSYANGGGADFRVAAKAAVAFVVAAEVKIPGTPAATWREKGEPDPHGNLFDGERSTLMLGDLTDDELANGAFMNYDCRLSIQDMLNPKPGQHMPIVWMTAAKERIRWLSRALVRAQAAAQHKEPQ
jgi:hypothetical protein